MPTEEEMIKETSEHLLTTVQHRLKGQSTTLQQVLDKVLEDVQAIIHKRSMSKARVKKYRENAEKSNTVTHYTCEAEKRREEKRREEKNKRVGNNGRFAPPSFQEVKDYCNQRQNQVDAQSFIDFYTANVS